jgi:O-6-methylguanine DNA methyltransferase
LGVSVIFRQKRKCRDYTAEDDFRKKLLAILPETIIIISLSVTSRPMALDPALKLEVLKTLAALPSGYVTTYSALGKKFRLHQRAIASIMRYNKLPDIYPCYRVVAADGGLSGYALGIDEKIRRLSRDGVVINDGKVAPTNIMLEW